MTLSDAPLFLKKWVILNYSFSLGTFCSSFSMILYCLTKSLGFFRLKGWKNLYFYQMIYWFCKGSCYVCYGCTDLLHVSKNEIIYTRYLFGICMYWYKNNSLMIPFFKDTLMIYCWCLPHTQVMRYSNFSMGHFHHHTVTFKYI